jgi:hypothetical protein
VEEPGRFDPRAQDDFARWDGEREAEIRWAGPAPEYLPAELEAYAGEFERHGTWRVEVEVGHVWVPRVEIGWRPYTYGHWAWTPYGWTWVPYERWGWAPFHYGRWGLSASWGWYWIPGRTWGPGWVSWAVGGGYVGWCPLGWRDRPVRPWGGYRGHGVPRDRWGGYDPWNVVRHSHMGGRDVARRRVASDRLEPGALRVAETPALRPTRDARDLRDVAVPRAISRRPAPGDSVRELAVDGRTTIPAPWVRRGSAPRGETVPRYETTPSSGATRRGGAAAPAPAGRERGETLARPRRFLEPVPESTMTTPRSAPRSAPRAAERPTGERGGERGGEVRRAPVGRPPASESGAWRPRSSPTGADSGTYRPRSRPSGGESGAVRPRSSPGDSGSGTYRPRSSPTGSDSGVYRPRSSPTSGARPRAEGGGTPARSSGGSQARPSGGGSSARPSSGGGSQARPSGGGSSARPSGGGAQARPSGGASRGGGSARTAPRPERGRE